MTKGFTAFTFNGEHGIVVADHPTTHLGEPDGVGIHTFYGIARKTVGTLVDKNGEETSRQEVDFPAMVQLAKDEVMRLYEEQVYGVESRPTDLVIEEWKQKEIVAKVYLDPTTTDLERTRAAGALLAAVTTKETLLFAAEDPPLVLGTDDIAIATRIAEDIIRAAWAKRTLLTFAGRERRNANDLIDMASDYLDLVEKLTFIQTEVPLRTAAFLSQFA